MDTPNLIDSMLAGGRIGCINLFEIDATNSALSNSPNPHKFPMPAPSEITFLVQKDPEGGYVASALGHSIVTQADDYSKLRIAVRDAVQCHFEEARGPKAIHLC